MKSLISVLILILNFLYLNAQNKLETNKSITPNSMFQKANAYGGKEFVLGLPQLIFGQQYRIYITSKFSTPVTISQKGFSNKTYSTKANDLIIIDITPKNKIFIGDSTGYLKIYPYIECPSDEFSISLTSKEDIIVYTNMIWNYQINNYPRIENDGYFALPVSAWGNKYYNLGLYSFFDIPTNPNVLFNPSFLITSNYANTSIKIIYKDQMFGTYGAGRTYRFGKKEGDTVFVVLNKGESYWAPPLGDNRYDYSGTYIESDKPIGVISQGAANLPTNFQIKKIIMSEMLMPVSSWGKRIASVEFNRDTDKGDFLRVIASENNTLVTIKSYKKRSQTLLKKFTLNLKAGQIWEYNNYDGFVDPNDKNITGIRGAFIIEANKPILAMQFSYPNEWDFANTFDIFATQLPPIEHYTYKSFFACKKDFLDPKKDFINYLNFIAIGYQDGDENKKQFLGKSPYQITKMKLYSIKINGEYIDKDILQNNIYGTNLYWYCKQVKGGLNNIESENALTKFGGYAYGGNPYTFTENNEPQCYGWPAAMELKRTGESDIIGPRLEQKNAYECGLYSFSYSDTTSLQDKRHHVPSGRRHRARYARQSRSGQLL